MHQRGFLGELVTHTFLVKHGLSCTPNFSVPGADSLPDITIEKIGIEVKTQQERNWTKFGRTVPASQLKDPHWHYIIFVTLREETGKTSAAVMGWASIQDIRTAPEVNYGTCPNYQLPIEQVRPIEDLLPLLRIKENENSQETI